MILRNCVLAACSVAKKEKAPHIGRLSFRFDLTKEIANQFNWDCLFDNEGKITNGWDTLPLKGEIAIVSAKLKPNSKKSAQTEIKAQAIATFSAHRVKGKGEGESTFYLSAVLVSADEEFEQRIGPYWRGLGDGGSQLVATEAQASMFPVESEPAGD